MAFVDAGHHELKGKAEPAGCGGPTGCCPGWAASSGSMVWRRRCWPGGRAANHQGAVPHGIRTPGARAGTGLRTGRGRKVPAGWEFEKYIDGLAETVWWHRGRCLSYGEGVAFWALAEIVRQRLGIAEEDPAETAANKLAAG